MQANKMCKLKSECMGVCLCRCAVCVPCVFWHAPCVHVLCMHLCVPCVLGASCVHAHISRVFIALEPSSPCPEQGCYLEWVSFLACGVPRIRQGGSP
jgi:hypothetical protein